ncbi:MAG TPA: GLPGLI family protein [Candidatus Amulumruptor caecigallinarius]|uniref:GLPGLI family protein n=1 Tax=Candidatus Amulumruptor caecigallinarius TaxID=2109911 RepID=A0A921JHR6_9BACT|nr:GLPGLI family protein [Candidatus Amulumruptor caecigallinarius]
MKRLIHILTLSVATTAFANGYVTDAEPAILEVHYERTEHHDSTDHNNGFFKDPVMLRVSKNKSVFCGIKKLWQDSIMRCDKATFWAMEQARVVSGKRDDTQLPSGHYWSYVYKNIPEGKVTERCYFDMERWQYSEDWEKPEWEIGDSIKIVLGYECIEASANYRGRTWTAWFAPELPVQEGPWKLCGLPGLILEAHDANSDYIFEATGLLQNPNAEVGIFTYDDDRGGYSTVTRDKFFNNWWRFKHSNPAAKIQAAFGVGTAPTNEKTKPVMYDKEERNYPTICEAA